MYGSNDTSEVGLIMNGEQLKQSLKAGKRVYSTLVISTSPRWPDEVRKLDLDFVFLDGEHMPLDRDQLSWLCRTYEAMNLATVVRIPSADPYHASMALDGGASGILAPYIETAEQVKALRAAVKLRPLKGAKSEDILHGEQPDAIMSDYLEEYNKKNLLMINIESVPAIEALDEILAVPQLDAVIIGPHDLSCSLGIPEQYRHPLFEKSVQTIIKKAKVAGVAVGIHYFFGVDQEIHWLQSGMNILIHASDMTAFSAKISSELNEIKSALGDEVVTETRRIHI